MRQHDSILIASDRAHDAHYAHRCVVCDAEFDNRRGTFVGSSNKEGDICEECTEDLPPQEDDTHDQ